MLIWLHELNSACLALSFPHLSMRTLHCRRLRTLQILQILQIQSQIGKRSRYTLWHLGHGWRVCVFIADQLLLRYFEEINVIQQRSYDSAMHVACTSGADQVDTINEPFDNTMFKLVHLAQVWHLNVKSRVAKLKLKEVFYLTECFNWTLLRASISSYNMPCLFG